MWSQIARSSGMSCSMTSIGAAGVLADPEQQRAEGLGLLLGDAAGRLVEQEHLRVLGEDARQVDDAAAAGRQLAGELLAEGVEAHELDELVDLSAHRQLGLVRRRQLEARRPPCRADARWRSRATAIVSATVSVGIEQRVLERPAEPARGALVRRRSR